MENELSVRLKSLSKEDFDLYRKISKLKAIRDHNLICELDKVIDSVEIRESEQELAILEYEEPRRYRKISALCS